MIRILHISDAHSQFETMNRLENLAWEQKECEIVAFTGDCCSSKCRKAPRSWDSWPQTLLLAVPGNHDDPDTYKHLTRWRAQPPYAQRFDDLIFIGLTSHSVKEMSGVIKTSNCHEWQGCQAVVILFHAYLFLSEKEVPNAVCDLLHFNRILFLHGHAHPRDFPGATWQESQFGTSVVYRSHVCSSVSGRRGLGHRIEWDGHVFRCSIVQGKNGEFEMIRPASASTPL